MNLETSVYVQRTPEAVWAYLGDISNVAKWDRGVARVQQTSMTSPGVGLEFDTLGHSGPLDNEGNRGKMSYRISEADPAHGCTVQLTSSDGNARFFKTAEWRFRVEPADGGSTVYCVAHFKLKFPYIVLAPVFYAMKKAIHSDLIKLKQVLEDS